MKKLLYYAVLLSLVGCATTPEQGNDPNAQTKKGAGIGAAVGAVAGSIVSKDKKKGAVIGGVLGGIAGGAYGKRLDKQAQELEEVAETRRTDQGIITKLKGDITFNTGKSTVRPEARERLGRIADILKKYPENEITVIGHTDATGSKALNERLSKERAAAVKSVLAENGVSSANINTMGVADSDPIASNQTAEGREANRRVEMAITIDEERLEKSQRRAE